MLSQREAASQWHLSRATIQRAIKAGKLSLTAEKTIDPAEMLRAFGEPIRHRAGPTEPPGTANEPAPDQESAAKDARIAALEATVAAQARHIESLDRAMLLLGNDRPKRRWWQAG